MEEMYICPGIIIQLIKKLLKFINSEIKVYPKIGQYFLNNLIYRMKTKWRKVSNII